MAPVMNPVYSSHVDSVGFDAETKELYVEWDSGKTSIYSGVSAALADEVSKSWSVGKAVREQIIDKFPHRYA